MTKQEFNNGLQNMDTHDKVLNIRTMLHSSDRQKDFTLKFTNDLTGRNDDGYATAKFYAIGDLAENGFIHADDSPRFEFKIKKHNFQARLTQVQEEQALPAGSNSEQTRKSMGRSGQRSLANNSKQSRQTNSNFGMYTNSKTQEKLALSPIGFLSSNGQQALTGFPQVSALLTGTQRQSIPSKSQTKHLKPLKSVYQLPALNKVTCDLAVMNEMIKFPSTNRLDHQSQFFSNGSAVIEKPTTTEMNLLSSIASMTESQYMTSQFIPKQKTTQYYTNSQKSLKEIDLKTDKMKKSALFQKLKISLLQNEVLSQNLTAKSTNLNTNQKKRKVNSQQIIHAYQTNADGLAKKHKQKNQRAQQHYFEGQLITSSEQFGVDQDQIRKGSNDSEALQSYVELIDTPIQTRPSLVEIQENEDLDALINQRQPNSRKVQSTQNLKANFGQSLATLGAEVKEHTNQKYNNINQGKSMAEPEITYSKESKAEKTTLQLEKKLKMTSTGISANGQRSSKNRKLTQQGNRNAGMKQTNSFLVKTSPSGHVYISKESKLPQTPEGDPNLIQEPTNKFQMIRDAVVKSAMNTLGNGAKNLNGVHIFDQKAWSSSNSAKNSSEMQHQPRGRTQDSQIGPNENSKNMKLKHRIQGTNSSQINVNQQQRLLQEVFCGPRSSQHVTPVQMQEHINQLNRKSSEYQQTSEKTANSSLERFDQTGNRTHVNFGPINQVIQNMSNQRQLELQEAATNEYSQQLLLGKLSSTPGKHEQSQILQKQYQRKRPFQLKPKTGPLSGLLPSATLNRYQITETQPKNIVKTQENQFSKTIAVMFNSSRLNPLAQVQLPSNGGHQEEQILVQGIQKGLQPAIGKNLEQTIFTEETISRQSEKKLKAITKLEKNSFDQSSANQNREMFISQKNIVNSQNQHQIHSQLSSQKQIMAPTNAQQINPKSYLTITKNNVITFKQVKNEKMVDFRKMIEDKRLAMDFFALTPQDQQRSSAVLLEKKSQAKAFLNSHRKMAHDIIKDKNNNQALQEFVKQQLSAYKQASQMLQDEQIAMTNYQQIMQREIEKLRLHYVPDGLSYQKTSQTVVAPLTPIQNTHHIKSNKDNPMNIQTCAMQNLSYICPDCRGLVLVKGQKSSQYSQHFLICRCRVETADYNHQSPQGSVKQMQPRLSSEQSLEETARQKSQGTAQRHSSLEKRSVIPEISSENSRSDQIFNIFKLKEMQLRLLNSQPKAKQVNLSNSTGPSNKNGHRRQTTSIEDSQKHRNSKGEGKDIANIRNFIKKQVVKFYQNNLVHETGFLRQKGIECKGQTIGGMVVDKPLGSTLQEMRKQTTFDRDRRLNSTRKEGASLDYDSPFKKKLRQKAKSTNLIGLQDSQREINKNLEASQYDFTKSRTRRQEITEIGTFLLQINEFVRVTLKYKETITQTHLAQIRRLGRQIGLKFGNVKELDAKFINSKDFIAILKSKIFCMLNEIVIRTNLAQNQHQASQKTYKFYVEPSGNNHTIVRSVIKRRGWFSSQEISKEQSWTGEGPKLLNLIWTQVRRPKILRQLQPYQIYNHLDGINEVSQKSRLFLNMSNYYQSIGKNVFNFLPETYLIPISCNFELNSQFKAFRQAYEPNSIWIFKPGESTNRGNGIKVFKDYEKIKAHIMEYCRGAENKRGQGRHRHFILQRYIRNPLLINKRKFDIRVFALAVCHAETKIIRGYFYEEGYLRTSSKDFNLDKVENRLIHLTNDAVQKNSSDYGKYESANKISYLDFEKHLLKEKNVSFLEKIVPRIKELITDVFEAAGRAIYLPSMRSDGVSRSESSQNYNAFELMGFDFMLDDNLNLVLIEVNTNPCLELPCTLLQRIIPQVLDQTLKLAVDPFLRASEHQYYMAQDLNVAEMRFQLIYQDSMELAKIDQLNDKDSFTSINMSTGAYNSMTATDRRTFEGLITNKNSIETLVTLEKKPKQLTRRITEPILSEEKNAEESTEI